MTKKMIVQNKKLLKQGFYPTKDLTQMRDNPVDLKPGLPIVREDGENAVMHMLKTEYDNLVEKYGEQEGFNMMDMLVAGLHKRYLFELIVHEAA